MKSQEAILEADTKAIEALTSAGPTEAAKSENARTTPKWKTTVNDARALYKIFPDLCEVSAKMSDVNAAVKKMVAENPDQPPALPGCTIERVYDVSAK